VNELNLTLTNAVFEVIILLDKTAFVTDVPFSNLSRGSVSELDATGVQVERPLRAH
jgi:hypothetical protein